jgi:hypothetical protein
MEYRDTFTLTFGGQVENGEGMEKIGEMDEEGFTKKELKEIRREFESQRCECVMIDLAAELDSLQIQREMLPNNAEADVLVIREGVKAFCSPDSLYQEMKSLKWDTKALMRGRVVNKHARHNLCFADFSQEPDYDRGKGRVIDFEEVKCLREIRDYLPSYLGPKGEYLLAEGNYYYDAKKCGIGYHGDRERKKVAACRVGASMNLMWRWFHRGKPIQEPIVIELNHGDMYVMSEKAVGTDWYSSSIPTLRHAAGAEKFTRPKGE